MINYTKLLMVVSILLPCIALSQKQFVENGYAVTRYTEEDGLKRNIINKAIVDKDGFLWLTSTYSIQKFNGRKIIDNPQYDKVLFVDWPTSLFINPQNKHLSYIKDSVIYQYNNGCFKPMGKWAIGYGIVLQNGIAQVNKDFFTNPKNNTKDWFSKGSLYAQVMGFCLNKDTFAVKTPAGICFATSKGIFKLVGQKELCLFRCRITNYKDKLIALTGKTLYVLNAKGEITGKQNLPFAIQDTACLVNRCDTAQQAYLYANKTIYTIRVNNNYGIDFTPLIQSNHLTRTSYVWEKDANTKVCISAYNGFLVYRKLPFVTATVPGTKDESNIYYAQALIDSNTIFSNNAIFRNGQFISSTNKERQIHQQFIIKQNNRFIYSLIQDVDIHALYSAPFPGCVDAVKLKANNIQSAFADKENRIWMAEDIPDFKIKVMEKDRVRFIHKNSHWVSCFYDADTAIWVGTLTGGLASINKKTYKYTTLKGFEQLAIRNITRGTNGILWLNTYGQGIWAIHNHRLKKLNLDNKQHLLLSHSFIQDSSHRVWIPTNNGIFVVLYSELEKNLADPLYQPFYYRFDKLAGFNTNEFNGGCNPAYLQMPDGSVSLPSMNGLVRFKPLAIDLYFDPSVCIEQLAYDTTPIPYSNKIVFPNTSQTVSFNISTPEWQLSPMQQLLQFQLVRNNEFPGEKAWQSVPENGRIAFSLLKTGHYQLIVRKRTGLGEQQYATSIIPFEIPLYWHQTNAFYTMLIVAALLGIYAFTRMRLKMLHKNNEVLKNAVDVAVSSLNETLKALQHSNAQKDKLFSILSHDMRSPINNLITVLQHTESDIMNRENISQALLEVKKDATTIQKTLDNLLNWSMLQMGKKQASKNALKMHSFLKSHIKLYNKLAQDKSIHVSTQCDADIVIEADRNQMAVIFRNFIDNAIKFTPHHGTIIIGVIKFPFYYTLYVANSGNPISQNAIDRILDSQEICTTLGTNNEKGTGLGLQLCKEFILSMNSRLEISVNNENRYTVFSFNLAREVQTE